MSKEIITKINRVKGFDYRVDRDGNVIQESYNWFKDKYTLVTLAIVILAVFYYAELQQSVTNEANFGNYCMKYQGMVKFWEDSHSNQSSYMIGIRDIISYYELNYNKEINITGLNITYNGR